MITIRSIVLMSIIYSASIFGQSLFLQNFPWSTRHEKISSKLLNPSYFINGNQACVASMKIDESPFNNIDNPQIDSVVINKLWSANDNEIIKYYYTYDSLGNVFIEIKKNYWKETSTYNINGDLESQLFEVWENDMWNNLALSMFTYDTNHNLILYLQNNWIDGNWIGDLRSSYYYNINGDLESYTSMEWNGSEWENSFRKTFYFDNQFILTTIISQNWGEGDWNGYTWKDTLFYNSDGNVIQRLSYDLFNGQWIKDWRRIFDHDSLGFLSESVLEGWQDVKWVSQFREQFTNRLDGQVLWHLEEYYENGMWYFSNQVKYLYNTNGYLDSAECDRWVDTGWTAGNNSVIIYDNNDNWRSYFGHNIKIHYATTTSVGNTTLPTKNFILHQNYPNPFNPLTTISYYIPESIQVELKVFDILGREVVELINEEHNSGNYKIIFDGSALPSGIYFYRLQSQRNSKTRKLILLK